MAAQLAAIATQYDISHSLVTSESFIQKVLLVQKPVPWLSEFRYVLDPDYPATIYERGAETASRLALDLRDSTALDPVTDTGDPAESDGIELEHVG